ncbi:MAG: ATP12 family protein [Pseudomonadota bacterium]
MVKADRPERPKRFYKSAQTEPAGDRWQVTLDGRVIRTPASAELAVPSLDLAEAIAGEWNGQGPEIDIQAMHLTRLANVAIDRTPATRAELVEQAVQYCETDLTCFLDGDPEIRAQQEAVWRRWREWAGKSLDIVLVPVEGLLAAPQPAASLDAVRRVAGGYDDFRLTGLAFACGLYGSGVLALAVCERALDADQAFDASIIDETIQAARWGLDSEAAAAQAGKRIESAAVGAWVAALST